MITGARNLRIGTLVVATALLVGLAFTTLALTNNNKVQAQTAGNSLVTNESSIDPAAEPLKWTREMMLNAKPMPMPLPSASRAEKASEGREPSGPPGIEPGGTAGQTWSPKQEGVNAEDIMAALPTSHVSDPYPYPPPYTSYENFANYNIYPYRTTGVLFFTLNGGNFRCSASSIGNYAIWTAGHCVSDGAGNFASNFTYVQGYKDGSAGGPDRTWTGSVAWVTAAFHNNSDLGKDMGGVVLDANRRGPVSVMGWLGFAWNFPINQHHIQLGYPAAAPFNGNRMHICASSRSSSDHQFISEVSGTNPVGHGCDQTGGSSGGPWIMRFSGSAGASNYLNGNTSYGYTNQPEEMYSPYFDQLAKDLKDALVGDIPPNP